MLYLASTSKSRQQLLKESKIEYTLLRQSSDEAFCRLNKSLKDIVQGIAISKMEATVLPTDKQEGNSIVVLAADTLGLNDKGQICGKPTSKEHAIEMIKSYRNGAVTGTGFCLDRKQLVGGVWQLQKRILGYAQAEYIFDVPDALIEWYLEHGFPGNSYMNCSGGVEIEGAGLQFLKEMNGSYTAVLGLPMYEVRQALLAI